jgi:hypothetical protein
LLSFSLLIDDLSIGNSGLRLLDIEPRLRKVRRYKCLPQLRVALHREIDRQAVKNDLLLGL